jgi:hypothetical protein
MSTFERELLQGNVADMSTAERVSLKKCDRCVDCREREKVTLRKRGRHVYCREIVTVTLRKSGRHVYCRERVTLRNVANMSTVERESL